MVEQGRLAAEKGRLLAAKTRLLAEQARLEAEKGRTTDAESRKLESQDSLDRGRTMKDVAMKLFSPDDLTIGTAISTMTEETEPEFDKDSKWTISNQELYNMKFVALIDQLERVDKIIARGYIYRYLCLGYGEAEYLDGLLSSKVTSVKNALREAGKIMLSKPGELGLYVKSYLDAFAKTVTEANAKWKETKSAMVCAAMSAEEIEKAEKEACVFVYYRKYNQGQVDLVRAKVFEAGFRQEVTGKLSFDVSIVVGDDVVDTVMSRIQKEEHT